MASYEPRGDSIRVVVRLPGGGKKSATFDTRREAQKWADLQERKKSTGELSPANTHTVADLFETYLDEVAGHADTAHWNKIRLDKFSAGWFGATRVVDVTPAVINRWARERLKQPTLKRGGEPYLPHRFPSEATVQRELNLLGGAFKYAVKSLKWIAINPVHDAEKFSNGTARHRPLLQASEILAIQAAGGYRDDLPPLTDTSRVVAAFLLALETGMRSGEILRLKPRDFDAAKGVVVVTALEAGGRKGSHSGRVPTRRVVPLTPTARRLLQRLIDTMPEDQAPNGSQLSPPYIVGVTDRSRDALWRKVRDRACVEDLRFHDTKHEACTRLSKFLDVIELSHAVGTKDLKLLRDTYYVNNAEESAKRLPDRLAG